MKNFIYTFCRFILIWLFFQPYVFAFEIKPGSVSGKSGSNITVPILINNISSPIETDAMGFTLNFNTHVLAYVETDKTNTLTSDFTLLAGQETKPGSVKVAGSLFDTPVMLDTDGVLVNIRFKVLENAVENTQLTLSCFKDDIAAAATSPALFTLKNEIPPDTTLPVITLVGDSIIEIKVGQTFTDPGATAVDDIDGNISDRILVSGSVDTLLAGTYTLTYTVSDAAGNKAIPVTRTITVNNAVVKDTTPPVITLTGAAVMIIEQNTSFTDPGATAVDDIDGNISDRILVSGSVDTLLAGTYTLTYTASDAAGNKAIPVTRTITVNNAVVKDTIPPVITLNGTKTIEIEKNSNYHDPGATAFDNKDGDLSDKIKVNGNVNTSVPAKYVLKYTVSDSSGNLASLSRVVIVRTVDTNQADKNDSGSGGCFIQSLYFQD